MKKTFRSLRTTHAALAAIGFAVVTAIGTSVAVAAASGHPTDSRHPTDGPHTIRRTAAAPAQSIDTGRLPKCIAVLDKRGTTVGCADKDDLYGQVDGWERYSGLPGIPVRDAGHNTVGYLLQNYGFVDIGTASDPDAFARLQRCISFVVGAGNAPTTPSAECIEAFAAQGIPATRWQATR